MIQAELRYLHSPDLFDLPNYQPDKPDYFCLLIQAMIGTKDSLGEESFDFIVCTPQWLADQMSKTGYVFGKNYLLLLNYDYSLILQTIKQLCDESQGKDWETVANSLSRYGQWEFENYDFTEDNKDIREENLTVSLVIN
jgi:Immunity protein 8